ncbi:hypothetical protein D3C81_2108000 [compost metagenome]
MADAEAAIPLGTVAQDARYVGQRLGIVDDGRCAMHAVFGGKRRLAARKREPALDARDDRGFLAADIQA